MAFLLLGGLAHAGIELYEVKKSVGPDGIEYSLEAPAAEVHLVLAFRRGLGTMGERATAALASAQFLVEYNDADRSTCYWNKYRPLPFDQEANPDWFNDDDSPGFYATEGASAEMTGRTLVVRFPSKNRWRVRVTPLLGDTDNVRRSPTLVQVAELRDALPRKFEELDPLPAAVEEIQDPAPAVEEEAPAEEVPYEEIVEEVYEEWPAYWGGGGGFGGPRDGSNGQGGHGRGARRGGNGWPGALSPPLKGYRTPTNGSPVAGTIPPFGAPVAGTIPPLGAPVHGTIPAWGAPLPFWAVPKAKAPSRPPASTKRPPRPPVIAPRRAP
jgi:hypothetical protein